MSTKRARANERIGKQATGIAGLDDLLGGGIPERRITLVQGGPGSGKTVLSMQAMLNHVRQGGHGVVVAFEEQPDELVENLSTFAWDSGPVPSERLHYLDARLDDYQVSNGGFDIAGLLAGIDARLAKVEQGWILMDGLDLLLRILDRSEQQRRELYRLKRWVRDRAYSVILTAKEEPAAGEWSSDFLQYACDCIIALRSQVSERVCSRSLRVLKYRGTGYAASEFPYIISERGIEVPYRGTPELEHLVSGERVSSGIKRLDDLLGGGYKRGTSILVSGAPGTAKTTLGAAFLAEAAREDEKGLFVSFDESAEQIQLNARSIGIRLDRAKESGLLRFLAFRAGNASAEEHYARILDLIDEHQPRRLVIDPVSALLKGGGRVVADTVAERLLDYAKRCGITTIFTSLLHMESQTGEDTESQVSTLADTWISLTYSNFEGERNRALSIVKSRGSTHSNQVRELLIDAEGVHLRDVYSGGGAVLMGTARLEREAENRARAAQRAMEYRLERERVEAQIEDGQARLEELQRELEHRRRRLELLEEQYGNRREREDRHEHEVRHSRRADVPDPESTKQ